jgi:hypothetical protein
MGSEHLGLGRSGPARLVAGGLKALPAGSSLYVVRATVINNPNVGLTVAKGRGGLESQWSLHGASSPWWQERRRIVTDMDWVRPWLSRKPLSHASNVFHHHFVFLIWVSFEGWPASKPI